MAIAPSSAPALPSKPNAPGARRRGLTFVEILVVTVIVAIIVPASISAISRQSTEHKRSLVRQRALQLAEEGMELLLNGGFYHWHSKLRPALPIPLNPLTYERQPSGLGPFPPTQPVTLTVKAVGSALTDDAFNPYVGDATATTQPWATFRREYALVSRHGRSQLLECEVRVWYGPDDEKDRITIPVVIGNHGDRTKVRGIVWVPLAHQLRDLDSDNVPPKPALVGGPRASWGLPPESGAVRLLLGGSHPVTSSTPGVLGYPP